MIRWARIPSLFMLLAAAIPLAAQNRVAARSAAPGAGNRPAPVQYHAGPGVFTIDTENTTYAIAKAGVLNHIYWGPRITRVADLPASPRYTRTSGPMIPEHRIREEYVGWGGYFYDEPALKMTLADGSRTLKLEFKDHAIEAGDRSHTLRLTLADTYYPIEVRLYYRVYPGLDLIDRWAVITNNGQDPVTLESAQSATWFVPRGENYRLTHLSGDWGREYRIEHIDLTQTAVRLGCRTGLSGHYASPFFALDADGRATEESGQVWFGALHWSGNWKIVVEKNAYSQVRVTGGIEDFDFAWRLKGKESFTTPVFTGGFTSGGFGAMSRMLHRYQRDHVARPNKAHKPLPVIYNSYFALNMLGVTPTEEIMARIARQAADVGVELLVMDAGWQKNFGDWVPHPERFPKGLKPLVDRVHEAGMKFGIWVELENARRDSDLYRAHPDWAIHSPHHSQIVDRGRERVVLNLARNDVRDHLLGAMDRLIRENQIDCLKLDMNRYVSEPDWPEVSAAERKEFWVRYVRNLYYIFDELQKRFPNVIFENCAAGGSRVDLGMAARFERINRSDNQDPLDMPYLHEGFTFVNLPGTAGGGGHIGVVPNHVNKRVTPLSYRAHIAMLGSMAISLQLDKCTPAELTDLKKYVAQHKETRELIHNGDLYRLRSPRTETHSAFEYVSPDRERAVVIVIGKNIVRAGQQFPEVVPIRLAGLNPDWTYTVEGYKPMSGRGLMNLGVPVRLVGDYDSRVIRIRRSTSAADAK